MELMLFLFLEDSLMRKAKYIGDEEAISKAQEYPMVACFDLRDLEERLQTL